MLFIVGVLVLCVVLPGGFFGLLTLVPFIIGYFVLKGLLDGLWRWGVNHTMRSAEKPFRKDFESEYGPALISWPLRGESLPPSEEVESEPVSMAEFPDARTGAGGMIYRR